MKKYFVYLDDGHSTFKVIVPAKSEKDAREFVSGNGEVIAVKDVTKDFPISASEVSGALQGAGFGKYAIDLILRTLSRTGIADVD